MSVLISASALIFAQESYNESASYEKGINFGAGVSSSIMGRPYAEEEIAFRMKFKNGFGFDAGIMAMENLMKTGNEPFLYCAPFADLYYKHFYIGGGALIQTGEEINITPCIRTGFEFGNWNCGNGVLNMRIGLECTATPYNATDSDNAFSNALGSAIGSVFNVPKLSLGATYFLPM